MVSSRCRLTTTLVVVFLLWLHCHAERDVVVLAATERRRRLLVLLPELARHGGGEQRQGVARGAADGLDAWVFDVDDTCISNQPYYQAKHFGPYDPVAFRMWASRGICPGIPAMQWLFQTLKARGFRVFLLTGRDEETLGASTAANLNAAGFSGGPEQRGQRSVAFKSAAGYRVRGNVGDRVFKVPNPMYFVP